MKTYCNPLAIPDLVSGRALDQQSDNDNPLGGDYRSIADPSVVYHEGKWILYPSYSVAYQSSDFVTWEKIDIGIPHLRYSPAVVQFRGKWYLNGHGMSELYVSDSPTGPFEVAGHLTKPNGKPLRPADACFLADNDRLFIYYCNAVAKNEKDKSAIYGTLGAELCPDKPWQLISEPVEINRFEPEVSWQCHGARNQNANLGWIEGQWAKKINGRYYLLYSGCGTEYPTYANGICYSDEGPLSGFKKQKKHDPFSLKTTGIVKGAGHGCLCDGPNNSLWLFYTNVLGYAHPFERRISMDRVYIDENGELYCKELAEEPRYIPDGSCDDNDPHWLNLTLYQRPQASSFAQGREGIYACDDSMLSWWQPREDDREPTLTVPFGSDTAYYVRAFRLMWRDVGMDCQNKIMPGAFGYKVEYSPDKEQKTWLCLYDASKNTRDLPVDYRETAKVKAYAVRIKIMSHPKGITPGLRNFSCFGHYQL
ncbi:MAG: hypothetical protein E7646_03160 [Ruminococcaceae bacterium]|nr:hypothetical protein [Oscillospiraceae bacterium]